MSDNARGLTNLQRELLQLYSLDLSESSLREVKGILARYFADKASDAMDEVWERNNLSGDDMITWSREHNRVENRP